MDLVKNPLAWLVAVLLIAGVFANYRLGHKLTTLCELTQEAREWSVGLSENGIDATVQRITQLKTEDSLEGEVWRWQHTSGEAIEKLCADHDR